MIQSLDKPETRTPFSCPKLGATCATVLLLAAGLWAQLLGSGGNLQGRVEDPSGATLVGASVELRNSVAAYDRWARSDQNGEFHFDNIPFNTYELIVHAPGFQVLQRLVTVRSSLPQHLDLVLQVQGSTEDVEVQPADNLVENSPTAHTDIEHELVSRLPLGASSSQLTGLLTLAAPGLPADSNGQLDPFGEEGDTLLMIDDQPVTERLSRTTATQFPVDAIQSLEIIQGVPPAEFSEKTSLVARLNTRSGVGHSEPTGAVTAGYGSFGTSSGSVSLALGSKTLGNFLAASGLNTGRFLDTPEFLPVHAHGNSETLFDRMDYQFSDANALHLNLGWSSSWFQAPDTYDQALAGQDERQTLRDFNVAPSYSRLLNPSVIWNLNGWVRRQRVNYFPSSNLFSDQPATLGQARRLTAAGIRTDISYSHGSHNLKAGAELQHYFLAENFNLGLTDPLFNAVCVNSTGSPVIAPGISDPSLCPADGFAANSAFEPGLLPYDLTRGGTDFKFQGTTDIKQEAAYVQDTITRGRLSLMLGLRADNYSGLTQRFALQPRLGASYLLSKTQTVLRASYGRLFETPYNDNLILASATGHGGLSNQVFGVNSIPLKPGIRNQFNVGLQQAIGRHLAVDADYTWKFTAPDFDSDALFDTPLIFPTSWRRSKIDGVAVRVVFPDYRGWSAFSSLAHLRARFFGPETGGILFEATTSNAAFRIDQDEAFEQTTHLQYQPWKRGPWFAFTWRYDSGLVVDSVPDFAFALTLTADQQAAIGLFCGSQFAALGHPIRSCSSPRFGATRIVIPPAGTQNSDLNPTRVAPRHLFDVGTGWENLFRADRYRVNLRVEVLNLTNNIALYNFLSTFSGTHFVPPRSYQVQAGVSF